MNLPDALTPLRDRRFAWYYAGRFISTTGSTMAPVALTFAVLDLTNDSPAALGQVLAANSIPMVFFLLVGGVVADRFSRSAVLQVSHLLSSLTQATVATLFLTGTADLWMVIGLEALNGTVLAFTFPAMFGVVPQIVPRSYLQQANAMLSFSRSGLSIVGPSIAALLVITVGPAWALALDSATWLVAAGCMARVGIPARVKDSQSASPNTIRELREGWTAFTEHTWLWLIVVAFGVVNAIHAGAWFTLAPAVAKRTIGIDGWGYVLSAEALGLLAMTLVFLKVRLKFPLRAGMLATSLFAIPVLIMGVDPHLLPLIAAAFFAGCGFETFSIGWNVAVQEHIDERVLSRVSSYDALGSFVAIPLGQLTFGPLGAAFGSRPVLIAAAAVYAVVALGTLGSRSVRNLQRVELPNPEVSTVP
jgi:MFS family permease